MSDAQAIAYFATRARDGSYAELYDGDRISRENWSFRARRELVVRLLSNQTAGRLLDAGCGGGELTAGFLRVAQTYTGIDAGAEMVERARRRHPGAKFLEADAERLPFADASFDTVCALGLLEYLPDPERGLDELCRVLKPHGRLIIGVSSLFCFQNWIKALLWPARQVLAFVYFRVMRRGKPYRVRHHEFTARGLARRLRARNMDVGGRHFYNPNLLCFPASRLWPQASARLSRRLEKHANRPGFRFLCTAFVIDAHRRGSE